MTTKKQLLNLFTLILLGTSAQTFTMQRKAKKLATAPFQALKRRVTKKTRVTDDEPSTSGSMNDDSVTLDQLPGETLELIAQQMIESVSYDYKKLYEEFPQLIQALINFKYANKTLASNLDTIPGLWTRYINPLITNRVLLNAVCENKQKIARALIIIDNKQVDATNLTPLLMQGIYNNKPQLIRLFFRTLHDLRQEREKKGTQITNEELKAIMNPTSLGTILNIAINSKKNKTVKVLTKEAYNYSPAFYRELVNASRLAHVSLNDTMRAYIDLKK